MAAQADEVAHLALSVGRILLLNGAETEQVEQSVIRFAAAYGWEAHVLVTYEALLLTLVAGDDFQTKIGRRVPAMNVGMGAITAVNRVVDRVERTPADLAGIRAELEALERRGSDYPRWVVVAGLGLTAASLSRLFGGDWATFVVTLVAGAVGTWLRQALGRWHANPVAIPFAAASLSGLIGGAGVLLGARSTPALCLVAPGMIIVPGVPLINGLQDMLRNHMTLGLSRLGFAMMITAAIALGLFVATSLTGVAIPVDAPGREVAVVEDAAFSALAALGYAFLFNVPPRMAWACAICGVASHTTRTLLLHLGIDIIEGTLIGALAAGTLAHLFARRFDAPAVAFAFPGVVAMVPGAFAFRAVLGGLRIAHGLATPPLLAETMALSLSVVLMAGAIAVGVAAPLVLFARRPAVRTGSRN